MGYKYSFYHYTDEEGYRSITKNGKFLPGLIRKLTGNPNSMVGNINRNEEGEVYFTVLDPAAHHRVELVERLHPSHTFGGEDGIRLSTRSSR